MPIILFITGVSASGKSTVGRLLSQRTGLPFFDGDDYHPEENITRMRSGQPLTDEHRFGWLQTLNALARQEIRKKGAIIACSALKAKYRELLSQGLEDRCKWVLLKGDPDTIRGRSQQREDHFMPASLLQSQFDTLEEPEQALVMQVTLDPEEIAARIIAYFLKDANTP